MSEKRWQDYGVKNDWGEGGIKWKFKVLSKEIPHPKLEVGVKTACICKCIALGTGERERVATLQEYLKKKKKTTNPTTRGK